jgi:capsular exopolysaccharide synthesis family protein
MTPPPAPDDSNGQADLERVIAILRRRAGLIALCFVVTAAAAVGFSLLQEKQYSASASLLFRNPGFAEDLFGTSATSVNPVPTREAATNEKLVGLDVIAVRTAERLKWLSPNEVSDMVSVDSEGEAEIVSVTATGPVPAQSRRVANEFARQFIAFRASTDKSKLQQAKRLAERQLGRLSPDERAGPRGEALSRAAEKLGILASLQTGNAELVQPADLPTSPSSPKPVRNGILGALIGLLLGIALAFLFERLNRRLRDPEEAREAFGLPVLGTVPESKAITASNEGATPELPFMENEAFRMLRASLRYFNVDRDVRSVLITSYMAGVGKSTIAWNLARVAASASKVAIVETDMRNPSLSQQHGLAAGPGLAELLTRQVELGEAIQSKPIAGGANGADGGERALDVIVAGANPPNPAELIESEAMDEVLAQLGERYELVVIDTAPMGVVSDAFPLLRKVDGAIVVTRIGLCTRDSAAHLRDQLERLEAPVLGIVANAVKLQRGRRYGYGYHGGYGDGPAAERPSRRPQAGEPSVGTGSETGGRTADR